MNQNKFNALLIEDDYSYQLIFQELIEKDNRLNHVGTVNNSLEAALAIHKMKPDILILDIEIVGIDGFELLELFDEIPETIIISSEIKHRQKAREIGAVGFLQKPLVQQQQFYDLIEQSISNFTSSRMQAAV